MAEEVWPGGVGFLGKGLRGFRRVEAGLGGGGLLGVGKEWGREALEPELGGGGIADRIKPPRKSSP